MKKFGLLVLMVALAAIAFLIFRTPSAQSRRIVVTLVPGPPQPKVSPGEAGIDPAAILAAVDYAGKHQTTALVIGRAGHIVFEKYWGDTAIDTPLMPGAFGNVLVPLLVGSVMNDRLIVNLDEPLSNYLPEYGGTPTGKGSLRDHLGLRVEDSAAPSMELMALVLERVTRQSFEILVSERLWKPMGGGEFSIAQNGVGARISDWMRIGEMLANEGVFEGNQFTPPRFVTLMLKPTHSDSPRGFGVNLNGAFAAADVAWAGVGGQRLWVVPSLRLVILRVGDEPGELDGWAESMIPDSIIRGTSGWRPRSAGEGVDPKRFAPH
ncbi:MAG TPA: hypothetical protein VFS58_16380 [Steroidobacteraceae bacterium]|nr:hypothetical protein [Steroidobacteraceae bacterium]